MVEDVPSVLKLVISFLLSFIGSCNGPDTQATPLTLEKSAYIELKLKAEELKTGETQSIQAILGQRLASLDAEVNWLGEQNFTVHINNVAVEDLKTIELAMQQGNVNLGFVREASETMGTLSLSDLEESLFTESIFAKAAVETDDFGYSSLALNVKTDYQDALFQLSGENLGRRLAIVIDETILSAPVIRAQVKENILISGLQDFAEAEQLALMINSGPLPVALSIEDIFIQD